RGRPRSQHRVHPRARPGAPGHLGREERAEREAAAARAGRWPMSACVWLDVCALDDIAPDTGECALIGGTQIAVVRVGEAAVYAIDNCDPFSKAYVLSRGIVGD